MASEREVGPRAVRSISITVHMNFTDGSDLPMGITVDRPDEAAERLTVLFARMVDVWEQYNGASES